MGDGSGRLGDCLRACVASQLDVDRAEVPHFVESTYWLKALGEWLYPRGLSVRWVDPPRFPVRFGQPEVIGLGMSIRGVMHAVVLDAATGALVHDPHPSRDGLLAAPSALLVVST